MTKLKKLVSNERLQYLIFLSLSIVIAGMTGLVHLSDTFLFQRYIGSINPFIAFVLICFLGAILLSFFLFKGWFAIYKKQDLKGVFQSSGFAALFGVIIIIVDLIVVFPANMNVLFPESLLFYPAIGFFVEILFHVLPLSVFLIFLTSLFKNLSHKKIIWISIFMVSLLEPIYQTILMSASGQCHLWTLLFVGLHVYLFNLFQLYIFKRYDFISMYSFRLVYYMLWHIAWGYARLKLLF